MGTSKTHAHLIPGSVEPVTRAVRFDSACRSQRTSILIQTLAWHSNWIFTSLHYLKYVATSTPLTQSILLVFFFFFSSPSGCPLFCFFFFLLLICEGSYTVPNEFTLTLLFNYRLPETQFRPLFSSMEDHWSLETGSFYAETSRVSIRTFPNQLFLKH